MSRVILVGIFSFLLGSTLVLAQEESILEFVKEGIEYHERGNYKAALSAYEKALKIDKSAPLVHYEMAYTYFALGNHDKAIEHADVVIKQRGDYLKDAFMVKANTLDVMGKSNDAIAVYEKALMTFPDDYLLLYNLALAQYSKGDKAAAEQHAIAAIQHNVNHRSSHYLLGFIQMEQGRKVPALLALYTFLLLEPDTDRSRNALLAIQQQIKEGVKKETEKNTQIFLSPQDDEGFMAAELTLSLIQASFQMDTLQLSEEAKFVKITTAFFETLASQLEGKQGFWWETYVPFYSHLQQTGHTEAYCYYISQTKGAAAERWIKENKDKMEAFDRWLKE
ncbi:MAG TPA: tetratricopeptide repeat protein [Saprospiraceae bacterium]|nr:tetratricopeptide repeat protein [Saprospiraceae bacterium]HMQ83393.1 tetratricopeptide repeat protein [Saprospiraceae bacterium]